MSGVLYGVYRTIRGTPTTLRQVAYGRGGGGQAHDLFPAHAREGIAEDGTPTGVEHVLVYGPPRAILQLRAHWLDRVGARRLLALLREDTDERIGTALVAGGGRSKREDASRVVCAYDLDVLHGWAREAADVDALVARITGQPQGAYLRAVATPPEPYDRARDAMLEAADPPDDPVERSLVAQLLANPADQAAALVYADWLEQQGRRDEAAAIRP